MINMHKMPNSLKTHLTALTLPLPPTNPNPTLTQRNTLIMHMTYIAPANSFQKRKILFESRPRKDSTKTPFAEGDYLISVLGVKTSADGQKRKQEQKDIVVTD
jgi:hypothetical protein